MHTDPRQVRPPGDRYEARQTHRKCLPFYLVYVVFEFGCKQQSPSEADLCKRLALPGRRGEQLTESRRGWTARPQKGQTGTRRGSS